MIRLGPLRWNRGLGQLDLPRGWWIGFRCRSGELRVTLYGPERWYSLDAKASSRQYGAQAVVSSKGDSDDA